ncbi:MAG: hydantoinase B/oxoprolinase family protein [Candidatus Hydrogenedentota bacterium]
MSGWEFWIDRGGTFTDVVARDPEGSIRVEKLLSDNPDRYADAPLHAIRTMLGLEGDAAIPAASVHSIKMGTTLATNALLERKGARVAMLVTKGFRDLLQIGYQDRPDLFALNIQKPETLTDHVIEIDERVMADGTVRKSLDEDEVRSALATLQGEGIDALAVVLIHGFAYPEHEKCIGAMAKEAGFGQISLSHEVAPEIKAVGRGDTTVVDAYLTPILREYIGRLRAYLDPDTPLRFMQSNGGLTDAATFSGKNAILSGPAGGVVAFAHVGQVAGYDKTIGFDMGGTSTDVSRFDGQYERVFETKVAGVRLKAPMMAIETVAAGGGSILRFEDGRFLVGPESAGAYPGPACYRNGGPATVTDANVLLGRVQAEFFPACFGPDGDECLDAGASRAALAELARAIGERTGREWSVEEVAAGFIRIANENMVKPIKEISVARGYDVQGYALVSFGGAGAQHACALAESLGMKAVLIHPYAGVLSAYGMGLADSRVSQSRSVLEIYAQDSLEMLDGVFASMEDDGTRHLVDEGYSLDQIEHLRSLDLRYTGVDAYLNVLLTDSAKVIESFEERHQQLYGFVQKDTAIEIVNARVESVGHTVKPKDFALELDGGPVDDLDAVAHVDMWSAQSDSMQTVPVYRRDDLLPGATLSGPALVVEAVSTIVLDNGWSASNNEYGHLVLTGHAASPKRAALGSECDPVLLEVFNNLFMSVATQMGETLERVSHSANIKERLDFSCAVFDAGGDLIANAPHIPVHLGAMSESVRAIIEARGTMAAGEVYVTNDPFHGGSHLPDVTVVSPVFMGDSTPVFFVASRGHHADIGGITPGSMPPFSTSIEEEGVVIHNFTLVSEDVFHEQEITDLLLSGPYPARNIPERMSDLRAQVAANKTGERLLAELCETYSTGTVQAYMGHVRENAAEAMRACIAALPDGCREAIDYLDSGARIACSIAIEGENAHVDFTGTDAQLEGNLNAPEAVVKAAVLYFFRCLVDKAIPLNAGCLDPITITIPKGSLLSPESPAAVVGGNVETSNRVVDVIGAALGVVAGSQGTMNNFTFGTDDFGYYETICGGTGAGPDFDGASAVHSHMTNTRITDPEVLERRYAVLLNEFSMRRGSGGGGEHRGGDGVIRRVEFLEAMEVGILSERRTTRPYSVGSAEKGQPGRNSLQSGGETTELPGHASVSVEKGDEITLETPGGGGYSRK